MEPVGVCASGPCLCEKRKNKSVAKTRQIRKSSAESRLEKVICTSRYGAGAESFNLRTCENVGRTGKQGRRRNHLYKLKWCKWQCFQYSRFGLTMQTEKASSMSRYLSTRMDKTGAWSILKMSVLSVTFTIERGEKVKLRIFEIKLFPIWENWDSLFPNCWRY